MQQLQSGGKKTNKSSLQTMSPIEIREEKELLSYENHTGTVLFTCANRLKMFSQVLFSPKNPG